MKIAIFGGSFDPIHTDHINIIKKLHNLNTYNEIWIIPTNKHAFDKQINTKIKHRVNMINIAIKKLNYVKIVKLELNNDKSYTIDTIKKLQKKYPDYIFDIIIGSDNINDIYKWKNISFLSENFKIISIKRKNISYNNNNIKKYKINFVKCKTLGISSTEIRNGEKLNLQIKEINDYISKEFLYIKDRLHYILKNHKERYNHCLNVGEMAYNIAKNNNIKDKYLLKKIKITGILHDITKYWNKKLHKKYIKKYCPNFINEPLPTLHSYSAYGYLKGKLLYDETICKAIKKHTTGDINMTNLEKIIFVADKISKERNYNNIDKYRELAFKDINLAFIKLLKLQYEIAIEKYGEKKIGKQIMKTYNKWILGY